MPHACLIVLLPGMLSSAAAAVCCCVRSGRAASNETKKQSAWAVRVPLVSLAANRCSAQLCSAASTAASHFQPQSQSQRAFIINSIDCTSAIPNGSTRAQQQRNSSPLRRRPRRPLHLCAPPLPACRRSPSTMPESGPPRSLGSKLAQGFLVCAPQAAAYGVCIRANVEGNLAKDVCADSFQQLRTCVMRAAKAKPAR